MDAKRGEGKARRKATQAIRRAASTDAMRRAAGTDAMLDMLVKANDHREARNGFTEAMEIINITLPKAFAKKDGPTFDEVHKRIIDEIYVPMLSDTDFTEPAFETLKREIFEQGGCIDLIQEVAAYCVFAVRAFFSGRESVAWSYACDARYWAGVVMMGSKRRGLPDTAATAKLLATMRSTQAREAAAAMLARSPKQAAKTEVFKLWQERYAGQHPRLRTNEQFATEGGLHRCSLYALTWQAIDECGGKLDVPATRAPSGLWKASENPAKQNASTVAVSVRHGSRVNEADPMPETATT